MPPPTTLRAPVQGWSTDASDDQSLEHPSSPLMAADKQAGGRQLQMEAPPQVVSFSGAPASDGPDGPASDGPAFEVPASAVSASAVSASDVPASSVPASPFFPSVNSNASALNSSPLVRPTLLTIFALSLTPSSPESLDEPAFSSLLERVDRAVLELPGGWFKVKGSHDFGREAKTPAADLVPAVVPAVAPAVAPVGAALEAPPPRGATPYSLSLHSSRLSLFSLSSQGLPALDFERFCVAWCALAEKMAATGTVEDYAEFSKRVLLAMTDGGGKVVAQQVVAQQVLPFPASSPNSRPSSRQQLCPPLSRPSSPSLSPSHSPIPLSVSSPFPSPPAPPPATLRRPKTPAEAGKISRGTGEHVAVTAEINLAGEGCLSSGGRGAVPGYAAATDVPLERDRVGRVMDLTKMEKGKLWPPPDIKLNPDYQVR